MKIRIYNTLNCKATNPKKPMMSINERTGLFNFSKACTELIGLTENKNLLFLQDETTVEDFYIVSIGKEDPRYEEGFKLRTKDGSFSFNSSILAHRILDHGKEVKHTVPSHRKDSFLIGQAQNIEGMTAHLVILSKPYTTKP